MAVRQESVMETFKVVLTFGSVDEILWFNHSNETSLAVLSHGTIYIYVFYKMTFGICLEFQCYALLGVKGLKCIFYYKLLIILQDTYRIVQFLKEYPL